MEGINNPTFPLISVVITTFNEEKNIENCLKSVKLQTYPAIEIIVVDNYSTDETTSIAKLYTDKVYQIGPERSAQRNYGMIYMAKGEYVIYLDADMIISPNLIAACEEYIKRNNFVALHISEIVLGKNYWSKVRRFERSFYDGTPIDGARFFNRSVFCEVGGFDEVLFKEGSGEDWDIDKKIKMKGSIGLLPKEFFPSTSMDWDLKSFILERGVNFKNNENVIFHNESEFQLIKYLRKKNYYAKGFAGYIKKWGMQDNDLKCQFGFTYRYWKVFTEQGKWKKLLKEIDKTLGLYFLRILIGFVFLLSKLDF